MTGTHERHDAPRRPHLLVVAGCLALLGLAAERPIALDTPATAPRAQEAAVDDEQERPELTLRLRPRVGFSPVRVTAVGRLDGGPDDFEEYYCAGVKWDWGDGTISEASYDCDPYEKGVSEIRRSFRNSHTFQGQGRYEVTLSLVQDDKSVVFIRETVDVRASMRDRLPF